jgi:ribosomal RNA-processing protein 12
MPNIQTKKTSSGNAFDDILYNSDSDAESENDVPEQSGPNATRGKGPQPTQSSQFQSRKGAPVQKEKKERKLKDTTSYIRNEGDEPMDLLSRGIAGGVASESSFFSPSFPSRSESLLFFLGRGLKGSYEEE